MLCRFVDLLFETSRDIFVKIKSLGNLTEANPGFSRGATNPRRGRPKTA